MFFKSGHLPAVITTCVLASGFASTIAHADELPLTLAEAERLALQGEPGYQELLSYAVALNNEADAARSLPDPTLRVGLANVPVDGGGFSADPMTQAQLGFRQAFPRRSIREASSNRFRSLSAARRSDAESRRRMVLESARAAWLDVNYWQQAERHVSESRSVFADLVEVTRSLYSEGRRTQHDVLRAQLELSRIDDRLITVAESEAAARARLSEWLGAEAYREVSSQLPNWNVVPSLRELQDSLQEHPQVHAANSAIEAGNAGVSSAREQRKAGWALDVGYGYRDSLAPDGMRRSDMVSVNVVVDLPFFGRDRLDHKLAAALGDRSATEAARRRLLASLESRLRGEYSRWRELTRRMELFESSILSLSADQSSIALTAYRNDAGDFADVTRSYIDALNTQIEYTRIKVERAKTYAALASLGGVSQ